MINKLYGKFVFLYISLLCSLTCNAKVGDFIYSGLFKFYIYEEGHASVTGSPESKTWTGDLVIPSGVVSDGVNCIVDSVKEYAFAGCSQMVGKLVIPSSIKFIGEGAFQRCGFTGTLDIPYGVQLIGNWSFAYDYGLSGDLVIPSSVTDIEVCAFYQCSGLTSFSLPSSITIINDGVFYECTGLVGTPRIPDSVTNIGDWAFYGCSGLTGDLLIPNKVAKVGSGAFKGCSGLDGTLTLPEGLSTIGYSAFQNCSNLMGTLNIPNLTMLGHDAFNSCSKLTGDIVIPEGIPAIESGTFNGCSGFDGHLSIPNGITSIGSNAFNDCVNLNGSLRIPKSILSIESGAFANCAGFTGSLDLSDNLTTIGDDTFKGCSGLTLMSVPNSVTSIGKEAFLGCSGITHLAMPSLLASLGENSFSTSELTIPLVSGGTYNAQTATSLYWMPTTLPSTTSGFYTGSQIENLYLKPPLYEEYKDNSDWTGKFNLSDQIPVTLPSDKSYITMCRDFDVDLTHTNDNLPEGIDPLKAYIVADADKDLRIVLMTEITYIPSRLKANVDGYKDMEEYVGVVLKGTPGYTYYYQIGEKDYTQGTAGQTTLETSTTGQAALVGASQAKIVQKEETLDGVTYKNYGLKKGMFLEYEREGVIPYNKAYLRLPLTQAPTESNAKVTMVFNDEDGTTNIEQVDLDKNCLSDSTGKDVMYNLQGMKVDDSYHGLVVSKGRLYYKK